MMLADLLKGVAAASNYDTLDDLASYPEDYIVADNFTLQIDINSEEELEFFKVQHKRFAAALQEHNIVDISEPEIVPSRTSGHYHVTIKMDKAFTPLERVAFQAIFGSDRKRELRNLARILLRMDDAICFEIHKETHTEGP